MKRILVTGGLGYIGSHTCVELLNNGYEVIIVDDLSNTNMTVLQKIEEITGKQPTFYKKNLLDVSALDTIFQSHQQIDAAIHFAAFKAVNESVEQPLKYYRNNLVGLINLLDVMQTHQVNELVFSSSATVYGNPKTLPITETTQLQKATNPYGSTKLIGEAMIEDVCIANSNFKATLLRYFNPVGAHESGLIGELPLGVPNNLMPYITQTAAGIREKLTIFGNNYDTKDGTCIRDFIHVVDLADAHLAAIKGLEKQQNSLTTYNVGTGNGFTVLEIVKEFERVNNLTLNYTFGPRRDGDVPAIYANVDLIGKELGWQAKKTLSDMVRSSWQFQKNLKK